MAKLKAPAEAPPTPAAASNGYLPQFGEKERSNLPRLTPRPPYLLMYHPERWTVIANQVVPLFGNLKLQAGINRIKVTRDGKFQKLEAQAAMEEQGWQIIPPDVDGPGTSYLRQAAPGVFVSRWETTYPGSAHIETDSEGFAAWCRSLLDRGVIPRAQTYVLELLKAKRQREHDDLADKVATTPSLRANVARVAEDLKAIEAELARYGRGEAVASKAVDVADLLGGE
jgi:hypothetical protein